MLNNDIKWVNITEDINKYKANITLCLIKI